MIHYCDWAGQGDIHILCSDTWTEPAWGIDQRSKLMEGVYLDESLSAYTFDIEKVSCEKCKQASLSRKIKNEDSV